VSDWQEAVAGDRLAVDRAFADRVEASSLTRQQWNVAMTAVEFEVDHADDPERARIVADTSRLQGIADEIRAAAQPGPQGAGTPAGGSGAGSGGWLASLKRRLFGGDTVVAEAERLAEAYAAALQDHLEEEGKFERVRERA
jgi:hypothetical protein